MKRLKIGQRISIAMALILAVMGLSTAGASKTVDVQGVKFDAVANVNNSSLALRGATLYRYRLFQVYTAAFYVLPEAKDEAQVLGAIPKRLVIHYHREIKREDIIEASERTLGRNPNLDLAALRQRLDLIYSWYENVREGDRFRLDYTPGVGSELFFNDRSKGVIAGDDFAQAFFGIWLSDYSLSEKYRRRLLGDS